MADQWLVTGAGGMLGLDLTEALTGHGAHVTAALREDLDVTDLAAVRRAVPRHSIVINTAGWTQVDDAEDDEAEAVLVNGLGAANVAMACAETGIPLIHMSTDYVLSGDASSPYPEDAQPEPINAYGQSKLVGELAVLGILPRASYVVRTSWMYGQHGSCFVKTILRLARDNEYLYVVDDQRGQPTWSRALAGHLVDLGERILQGTVPPGVYHCTSTGEATWFDLARAVFLEAGLDPSRIRPTTSARYTRPAQRPAYSVLGHQRWMEVGLPPMQPWRAMLTEALPLILP